MACQVAPEQGISGIAGRRHAQRVEGVAQSQPPLFSERDLPGSPRFEVLRFDIEPLGHELGRGLAVEVEDEILHCPVRLVIPGLVAELHGRMVDQLESLAEIAADEPVYWREGYRPHLTLGSAIKAAEGEHRVVRDISIAHLDGDTATVVASLRTQSE